jgi:enoyl-CoA hydratase/carnithine racemase
VAEDARLGIPSTRLGVVVNLENVERMVNIVGIARAKEILMAGRHFTGLDAYSMGLANEIATPGGLARAAGAFAAEIARLAPLSVQGAKRAIEMILDRRAVRPNDARAALEIDALVAEAYSSRDLAEGIRAQREKRPPDFEGR